MASWRSRAAVASLLLLLLLLAAAATTATAASDDDSTSRGSAVAASAVESGATEGAAEGVGAGMGAGTSAGDEDTAAGLRRYGNEFAQATLQSFAMIMVSEVGDKTFLIAAILAMTHARMLIFSGAFSALVVMTILSAALGWAVPALLPRVYVHYMSIVFFAAFGIKMLREWYLMDPEEGKEELEETEGELSKVVDEAPPASVSDLELGPGGPRSSADKPKPLAKPLRGLRNLLYLVFTPIWIQTFSLTFVAEWGDRSQIATIAMAAAANPFGITLGAIAGHAVCTGIAVIGGRLLAARISVKAVTLVGAVLFLIFALVAIAQVPSIV